MPVTEPASSLGISINNLFIIELVIGTLIQLGVTAAVIYFGVRYRARRGGGSDPASSHGPRWIEITWIAVPLVIVIGLFGLSLNAAAASDPPTNGNPDIIVTGHQWWWEAVYPQTGAVTANEIHIPTGKQVLIELHSADVIHDFWVPNLGRKMDAVPGQANRIWIAADNPGVYLGACAEYCGAQHAWMRLRVVAQSQADFATWQQQQAQPITQSTQAAAQKGAQLFTGRTCANCHAVGGSDKAPNVGPNLAHLGDRQTLGAGIIDNTPENLAKWLKDPQGIKPESLVPNLYLTDDEVQALVAYLEAKP